MPLIRWHYALLGGVKKKGGGGFGGAGAVAFCIIIRSALVTVEMVECVREATVRTNECFIYLHPALKLVKHFKIF